MPPACRLMQGSAAPLHIDTGLHCSGASRVGYQQCMAIRFHRWAAALNSIPIAACCISCVTITWPGTARDAQRMH